MTHHAIILNLDKGEITDVFVRASLDETYKQLFQNACRAAKRNPDNSYHGIKIIIFGSFWLEARSNDILRMILDLETKSPDTSKVIWNKLKTTSVADKLDIFYKLTSEHVACKHNDLRKKIKTLLDVRNRLAHFKDEPEEAALLKHNIIDKLSDVSDIAKVFDIPEISKLLKWGNTNKYAKTVNEGQNFFAATERYFRSKHNISHKNSRLPVRNDLDGVCP